MVDKGVSFSRTVLSSLPPCCVAFGFGAPSTKTSTSVSCPPYILQHITTTGARSLPSWQLILLRRGFGDSRFLTALPWRRRDWHPRNKSWLHCSVYTRPHLNINTFYISNAHRWEVFPLLHICLFASSLLSAFVQPPLHLLSCVAYLIAVGVTLIESFVKRDRSVLQKVDVRNMFMSPLHLNSNLHRPSPVRCGNKYGMCGWRCRSSSLVCSSTFGPLISHASNGTSSINTNHLIYYS